MQNVPPFQNQIPSDPQSSPSIRVDRDHPRRIQAVRPRHAARWSRPLADVRAPSGKPAVGIRPTSSAAGRLELLVAVAIGLGFVSLEAVLLLSAAVYA